MLLKLIAATLFTAGFLSSAYGKTCEDAEQFRISLKESIDSTKPDRMINISYYENLLNIELKKCGLAPIPTTRVVKQLALENAAANSRFRCKNKMECDKVFSLTQIYIVQNSDTKVQLANDTVIETYNPSELMKISLKALKLPRSGTSADVILKINCKNDDKAETEEFCNSKSLDVYKQFPQFIRENLIN